MEKNASFHIETTEEFVFTLPGGEKTFTTRDKELVSWILSLMQKAAQASTEE